MKEFTNNTAKEIFIKSLQIEQNAREMSRKNMEQIGCVLDSTADMFQAAANLRSLADSIEYHEIDENIAKDYEDEILM